MRVLHCIPSTLMGGAERQLACLGAQLRRQGWDVDVATMNEGPNSAPLRAAGVTVRRVGTGVNHDPRLLLQLIALIRRLRPDVVHAWLRQMDVLGGLAASITGTPWILGERTTALHHPDTMKNRLRSLVASRAALIVSNSRGGDEYWKARAPETPRRVIPNALPLDELRAAAPVSSTRVPADAMVVLFVGRFSLEKNIDTVMDTMIAVVRRSAAHVVLCGDGPERRRLKDAVAASGLSDRVHFEGVVEPPYGWMKRASVMVNLSFGEGSPNAVLEAMACGTPLVLSDIEAHRELVREEWAPFVPPDSSAAATEAVLEILRAPAHAAARAARARELAITDSYGADSIARQYDAAYRFAIAARTRQAEG